jgi:hypothetical protein
MRLGSLASATFVVAVLASSPSFAQLHIGVDMEEGENDVLTPVHPSQTSTMYAYDCVSLGLPYAVGVIELQYDSNADFNVSVKFSWTDTPTEVATNGCRLFPVCPLPWIDTCGPQITERIDYGVLRGSMNVYCAAAGGGISGGASYTRIAEATIEWQEPLEIYSPTALQLRLPVSISGSVSGAESFGNPNGTWAKAELLVEGTVLGQAVSGEISVESVSVIPEQDSISQTFEAFVSLPAGSTQYAVDLHGHARVEARAESAGFYGTVVGAATAIVDFPNSIHIGRVTLADGSPLPAGVTVRGLNTGIYYEGNVGATNRYCEGAPNSVGAGAVIDSTGSLSLADNDFHISVSDAPPSQSGLFLYGPNQIQFPFGDGFRCVGAGGGIGVVRLAPSLQTDASGSAMRHVDFTAPPAGGGPGQITAGDTWNFQFWYRDPAGPGGTSFNLSDALAVVFTL